MAVPCTEKEREEIKQNIQQFITLTKFYGLTTENLNLEHTIDWWATLIGYIPIEGVKDVDGSEYTKSRVITLTKYKTAAFVAAWSFTDLPPHPFNDVAGERDLPHILIGGRYHNMSRNICCENPLDRNCDCHFCRQSSNPKHLWFALTSNLFVMPKLKPLRNSLARKYFNKSYEEIYRRSKFHWIANKCRILGTNARGQVQSIYSRLISGTKCQDLTQIVVNNIREHTSNEHCVERLSHFSHLNIQINTVWRIRYLQLLLTTILQEKNLAHLVIFCLSPSDLMLDRTTPLSALQKLRSTEWIMATAGRKR